MAEKGMSPGSKVMMAACGLAAICLLAMALSNHINRTIAEQGLVMTEEEVEPDGVLNRLWWDKETPPKVLSYYDGDKWMRYTRTSESETNPWTPPAETIKGEEDKHDCGAELSKMLPPGYKLVVNKEYVKVLYAQPKEPYKSWTIQYSHGMKREKGEWKSLYHEPNMEHVDMSYFQATEKGKSED